MSSKRNESANSEAENAPKKPNDSEETTPELNANSENESDVYEVGYGKPPKDTRFKPGRSGNPKGRPKGSRNTATIVDEAMKKKVSIRENGKTRKVSLQEGLIHVLIKKAIGGDHKSIETLLRQQADNETAAETRAALQRFDPAGRSVLEDILLRVAAENSPDLHNDAGEGECNHEAG